MGSGFGAAGSPALRALNPPGMPPRRHTTAGDEGGSFVQAAEAIGMGYPSSSLNRSVGAGGGPVKRRGTGAVGEPSGLR
jgi:hypothetical protein